MKLTEFGAPATPSKLQTEPDVELAAKARRGDWDEGTPLYLAI
jgi:hypothetical protein